MYIPSDAISIIKKHGWDGESHIGVYWFENLEELSRLVDLKLPAFAQTLSIQLRWKTPLGEACRLAIIEHIKVRARIPDGFIDNVLRFGILQRPVVNFNGFEFNFENKTYDLSIFQDSFNTGKWTGWDVLGGIDLSDQNLHNVVLENVFLAWSNLSGCVFSQCEFKNVNLIGATLTGARLQSVTLDDRTTIGQTNIAGADFNAVTLNDSSVRVPFKLKEVTQLYLIRCLLLAWLGKFSYFFLENIKHTNFLCCDVSGMNSAEVKRLRIYIDWYQHVMHELNYFSSRSFGERLKFSLALLFTKCWHSYSVLAVMSFFVIFVYGVVYYLGAEGFAGISGFIAAVYFSVVTFTTLGYGEIHPITDFSRILVVTEVLIGYVLMGSFIFLIGHKVNDRF